MRNHNSANDNEIAILVFSVSTKDFPQDAPYMADLDGSRKPQGQQPPLFD
jgi:hypothetical protein